MRWKEVKTRWVRLEATFQTRWSRLTAADLMTIAGKRDALVQCLQRHYGTDRAQLEQEVDEFVDSLKPVKV